ncbi:Hypothetical predicted protein [Podarcis lilfordi]|uniref:GSK-3-binding protein-like n=1 Tax=Podarcis lilfordi TaxID=74358 RepID=A0AA35KL13_9SAUR|nr:Hypothetical predicted protein [Podarcis lilfordi]
MPCRRAGAERFLLLEHAVSLPGGAVGASSGSKEVDALVAKLGEVLQLSAQRRAPPAPRLPPKRQGRDRAAPYSSPRGLGFLASLHHPHPRPPHALSPASLLLLPPSPPSAADRESSPRVAKQLCGRGWLRSAGKKQRQQHSRLSAGDEDDDDEDDDPHRLLQELILSGNLIKEAVRRLQLAATAPSTAPAEASSATASPGSASSTGSCCCHSSSGEGDSAAASAYGVSALQPRP